MTTKKKLGIKMIID